jgi:hypothetical protein
MWWQMPHPGGVMARRQRARSCTQPAGTPVEDAMMAKLWPAVWLGNVAEFAAD